MVNEKLNFMENKEKEKSFRRPNFKSMNLIKGLSVRRDERQKLCECCLCIDTDNKKKSFCVNYNENDKTERNKNLMKKNQFV